MICDVHFGDTRYDLTPAMGKWLPNNHPEEQYTTQILKNNMGTNSQKKTRKLTLAFPCFSPPCFSPPTTMMQVRGKEVGRRDFVSCFLFVRSDEEVTHIHSSSMICDVHFGDTRNDMTPANPKWLPNDHTEEQYTTNKYSRIIWL